MIWPVELTAHARQRARERFPGLDAETVVSADVHDALRAGRVSASPPPGVRNGRPGILYAWTLDGGRVYVIAAGVTAFHVYSVLRLREAV